MLEQNENSVKYLFIGNFTHLQLEQLAAITNGPNGLRLIYFPCSQGELLKILGKECTLITGKDPKVIKLPS